MEKTRKLAVKPHSVNLWVFDGHVASPDEQVEDGAAEEQRQQAALVGIKMRKLNHFINKLVANGFCVLKNTKLKMYVILI